MTVFKGFFDNYKNEISDMFSCILSFLLTITIAVQKR